MLLDSIPHFLSTKDDLFPGGGGGEGGGVLSYFHTSVGSGLFWGFSKNEYFLGYEDFWGVITKLDYI